MELLVQLQFLVVSVVWIVLVVGFGAPSNPEPCCSALYRLT